MGNPTRAPGSEEGPASGGPLRSRLLHAVLLLMGLVFVGGVGFFALVVDWLRPDRAETAIAARPAPSRHAPLMRRSLAPTGDDPTACALEVEVRGPDGQPEPDVPVTLDLLSLGLVTPQRDVVHTDDDGQAAWRDTPCGSYTVHAQLPGLVGSSTEGTNPPGETTRETLQLREGARMRGRVVDDVGEPIEEATVEIGATRTLTDRKGRFLVHAGRPDMALLVDAFGYQSAYETWPMDDDGEREDEIEIVLEPAHEVRVHCAGRPDDACANLHLVCTEPMLPFGDSCSDDGGETICTCPEGDAAIRGGSRSVFVDEGETDVWLDFTDTGRITGRVTMDGVPVSHCNVHSLRIPNGLEDLPRGMVSAARSRCDPEGRFSIEGLAEGDWEVMIDRWSDGEEARTGTLPQRVRGGQTTDVGTIDLRDGGGISGVLIDGLTGDPMVHQPVLALRTADRGERTTPMGADSDGNGRFEMSGLPAGHWRLAHPLSPHEYTEVRVDDGVITGGVEVITSDATSLDLNGFDVAQLDDDLLVEDVLPGSPADLAGLLPGDRITGVQLAGFDLSGMPGGAPPELSRAILAHYDGPGVTLVVRRDDEEDGDVPLEVPLEW